MLRIGTVLCRRALARSYATGTSPHALVFLEHRNQVIESGSLSALTAAQRLGGKVTGLIAGCEDDVDEVLEKARKLKGLNSILHSSSEQYKNPLPETMAPLFELLLKPNKEEYTHVISATSSAARSLIPRVAARLDLPTLSDVTSIEHDSASNSTTFVRPIYAGNAISTVRAPSSIPIKIFSVRSTAFPPAEYTAEDGDAVVERLDPVMVDNPSTKHLKTTIAKSDRPDLGVASRVVSGGRALKNAETFASTIYPLADALGAAVGASRAAVDAGYVDNSLQVGQTGKVVAPELYVAIGISGAIQHVAGMKDSKLIVAINKDPDSPIFQIADLGLVADIFVAIPELVEKLKQ